MPGGGITFIFYFQQKQRKQKNLKKTKKRVLQHVKERFLKMVND